MLAALKNAGVDVSDKEKLQVSTEFYMTESDQDIYILMLVMDWVSRL